MRQGFKSSYVATQKRARAITDALSTAYRGLIRGSM